MVGSLTMVTKKLPFVVSIFVSALAGVISTISSISQPSCGKGPEYTGLSLTFCSNESGTFTTAVPPLCLTTRFTPPRGEKPLSRASTIFTTTFTIVPSDNVALPSVIVQLNLNHFQRTTIGAYNIKGLSVILILFYLRN